MTDLGDWTDDAEYKRVNRAAKWQITYFRPPHDFVRDKKQTIQAQTALMELTSKVMKARTADDAIGKLLDNNPDMTDDDGFINIIIVKVEETSALA